MWQMTTRFPFKRQEICIARAEYAKMLSDWE
jgi:hypothetical protein